MALDAARAATPDGRVPGSHPSRRRADGDGGDRAGGATTSTVRVDWRAHPVSPKTTARAGGGAWLQRDEGRSLSLDRRTHQSTDRLELPARSSAVPAAFDPVS